MHELRQNPKSAGELAELFTLSKSTLSGHFNVLKAADLVVTEKQGTTITYRLNSSVFDEVLGYLIGFFGAEEQSLKEVKNENTQT